MQGTRTHRIRNIAHAHAPQEHHKTIIVPVPLAAMIPLLPCPPLLLGRLHPHLLATTTLFPFPVHTTRVFDGDDLLQDTELTQRRVDLGQHPADDDAARRVRDALEDVRQLERRQHEPPLRAELARLPRDKFLDIHENTRHS
jgi:hypothetical protein